MFPLVSFGFHMVSKWFLVPVLLVSVGFPWDSYDFPYGLLWFPIVSYVFFLFSKLFDRFSYSFTRKNILDQIEILGRGRSKSGPPFHICLSAPYVLVFAPYDLISRWVISIGWVC